jgi:hypothetical protein
MPRTELPQPPSMTPPRAGPTCGYLTSFALGIGQVTYLEGPGVNPSGVVSLERLLVPCRSCDGDVPRLFEQVNDVLSCLFYLGWLIGLDSRGPVLQLGR